MHERLYQLGLGADFRIPTAVEVTPPDFAGLEFQEVVPLPRFVREVQEPVAVTSPARVAQYLMEHVYAPFEEVTQEELWSLLVNNKLRVTHEVMVYRGTVNEINTRAAEILREAVRVNAPALVLSHAHPSGDPSPSQADLTTNRAIHQAAKLLGISLLDHIIVGSEGKWVSLKDMGVGFDP